VVFQISLSREARNLRHVAINLIPWGGAGCAASPVSAAVWLASVAWGGLRLGSTTPPPSPTTL